MTVRAVEKRQVAGLSVTQWLGSGPTVFCLSGLGSAAPTWQFLAEDLPDAHVVAFDPRGRGDGQGMAGPTGLRAHAKDVAAIMAELDLTDVVVVGHSMGAYLAPLVAQEALGRVAKIVCIDGGIRPAFPFFMGAGLTKIAFRKQLNQGDKVWPDMNALLKKGKVDEALASQPFLRSRIETILRDEMAVVEGGLRPRLDVSRAVADAADCFFGPEVEPALDALTVPAVVILAENKMGDGQKPFVSDKAVAPWLTRQPLLSVTRLPGNHLTILFAPEVAEAVVA